MDNTNGAQRAAGTIFDNLFDEAPFITYNSKWVTSGDTFHAYLGAAVGPDAPVLPLGMLVCSVTPMGRRLLILSTELGNAVAFTPYMHSQEYIVPCYGPALQRYVEDTTRTTTAADKRFITVQGFARIFGNTRDQRNIHRIFQGETDNKRKTYLSKHTIN